ncbi:MAG: hypothetical protein PHW99_00740 [Rhodoferax sp.]|nr:hypothetical protein [Rhodoferax sp.]MDD2923672.1 hypothetical protein [Rhodoferax sp.]
MRGLFGLVGLLVALAVTGWLVRQQLQSLRTPVPVLQVPAPSQQGQAGAVTTPTSGTVGQQSQHLQQQFKQAVEGAMQARPMPADQ